MLPAKTPPVLLRSAKIQGYRPFRDFLATFGPLEILIGANGFCPVSGWFMSGHPSASNCGRRGWCNSMRTKGTSLWVSHPSTSPLTRLRSGRTGPRPVP
jgi:hypothetical protein